MLSNAKIILVCDGDTDYLFFNKAFSLDNDLSSLMIDILRPEDVGLKRRTGGGHQTLLKEAKFAAMKAASGYADGVFVCVDNDGDQRFVFPHSERCGDCRECEVYSELSKVKWGNFKKDAAIVFQAIETLLLSAKPSFTPQLEESLISSSLKRSLYGRQIDKLSDQYERFQEILNNTDIKKIKAKSYPYIKQRINQIASSSNQPIRKRTGVTS